MFTGNIAFFVEFVNIVNYKVYMDKDKIKNNEIDAQIISKEDLDHNNSRGVYMRDDHCDWGSSGLDQLINPINETN